MNIPIANHSSGRVFYLLAGGLAILAAGFGYLISKAHGSEQLALIMSAGVTGIMAVGGFYLAWSTDHLSVDVSDQGLVIRGPVYGRTLAKDKLKLDQAKMVDIDGGDGAMRPVKRSNGLGLSNLKFGWFKLQNGEKAFTLLGDAKQAIYIPTAEGYPLLMTPTDREGFLRALRS